MFTNFADIYGYRLKKRDKKQYIFKIKNESRKYIIN